MFLVISPAKKLSEPTRPLATSRPIFSSETEALVDLMQKMSPPQLQKLMGISENLALLNAERFLDFGQKAYPAILSFAGDTYQGLDALSLADDSLEYAQTHLGILSGLFGLLRPLDKISHYRLEMGTPLQTKWGKNLYEFWGTKVTEQLQTQINAISAGSLVNLASKEYFSVVQPKSLNVDVITPVFKDVRNGTPKVISFLAKRARGMMARFIIENRVTDPETLLAFNDAGYQYVPSASTPLSPVFIREN